MPSGLLRVVGTFDLGQFWPQGTSDADTVKVKVDAGAFSFRPHPSAQFSVTHAFDNAIVKGKTSKPAIEKEQIIIRLQGVDAPELHFQPMPVVQKKNQTPQQAAGWKKWSHDYRQPFGESSTIELGQELMKHGAGEIDCRVETAVDTPDEVFDTYGRLVGDIIVPSAGDLNVNQWLAENGWAYPTFYASMTPSEIEVLRRLAGQAKTGKLGLWRFASNMVRAQDFDTALVFRGKGARPNPAADRGKVVLPKLYRRLSTWVVSNRSKMVAGSFLSYLADKPDELHLTGDFLQQGPTAAAIHRLTEFIGANGAFRASPADLIFREAPSRLVNPNGSSVTW